MKRAILILTTLLVAFAAAVAHAGERSLTVLLTGGNEANLVRVDLTPDGRWFAIESDAVLEVGGTVCAHPEGNMNALLCEASAIAGFEVNANGGDDAVIVGHEVGVPTTLRGGPGNDKLIGGGADDKLIGGVGDDVLVGRAGNDWLYGGGGNDRLAGGSGDDVLRGGEGSNLLLGGSGVNDVE